MHSSTSTLMTKRHLHCSYAHVHTLLSPLSVFSPQSRNELKRAVNDCEQLAKADRVSKKQKLQRLYCNTCSQFSGRFLNRRTHSIAYTDSVIYLSTYIPTHALIYPLISSPTHVMFHTLSCSTTHSLVHQCHTWTQLPIHSLTHSHTRSLIHWFAAATSGEEAKPSKWRIYLVAYLA